MTTPPEVLAAMEDAARVGMCESREAHFAPAVQAALAAAEALGWELRPVEPTEEMEDGK